MTYSEMLLPPEGGAIGVGGSPLKQSRVQEILTAQQKEIVALKEKLNEVHCWAVCYPIAPSEDMMGNINRIIEITSV